MHHFFKLNLKLILRCKYILKFLNSHKIVITQGFERENIIKKNVSSILRR